MRVDILTLLPGMFGHVFDHGIVRRAREADLLSIETHPLTNWTGGSHQRADGAPYGGGPGMVLRVEPLLAAVEEIRGLDSREPRLILLSPRGRRLDQQRVAEFAAEARLLLVAGRYEGVDERFSTLSGAEEISVGDYVLSGGEIPAMLLVDAVARLLPGALGDSESVVEESFSDGLLEHPHYTRPPVVQGQAVPPVLLSGNHAAVREHRLAESVELTRRRRPDLFRAFAGEGRAAAAPPSTTEESSS